MKYSKTQRIDIGKQLYTKELSKSDGMEKYDETVDEVSAYETLTEQAAKEDEEVKKAEEEAKRLKEEEELRKKQEKEEEKRLKKEEKEREKAEAKRQKAAEKRKERIQKEIFDVGVKALKRGLLNNLLKR